MLKVNFWILFFKPNQKSKNMLQKATKIVIRHNKLYYKICYDNKSRNIAHNLMTYNKIWQFLSAPMDLGWSFPQKNSGSHIAFDKQIAFCSIPHQ